MKKILVAAGGTGGHFFPALSVVDKLTESLKGEIEFQFFGRKDKIEGRILPELGYKLNETNLRGISSAISFDTLKLPFKMLSAVQQVKRIIKRDDIDAVLCAGAYLSIPPGIAAKLLGKKLFLMEANINLGKANKFLADRADIIFTSFDETKKYFNEKDGKKLRCFGNPVRSSMLVKKDRVEAIKSIGLSAEKKTILIFGGSLGAQAINEAIINNIDEFAKAEYQIIWQSGNVHKFNINLPENVKLLEFIDDMAGAYAAADLVVSRSGATTTAELSVLGKPSILVPLPSASNNEQLLNAKEMEKKGAAIVVENSEIGEKLLPLIRQLITNENKLSEMSKAALSLAKPMASQDIANEIIRVMKW